MEAVMNIVQYLHECIECKSYYNNFDIYDIEETYTNYCNSK